MTIPAPVARQFTVEEANRTLPLVRMIVQDVVELFSDLQRRRERLVALRNRQGGKSRGATDPYEAEVIQMEAELEADVERLEAFIEELRKIGADLKDPVAGLVDFPSLRDGREVCLCWRLGEPAVSYWHHPEAGFGGRHLISEPATEHETAAERHSRN